ncbi:MAG: hypothetical protein ACETVX_05930 [bacterium]|nr:hypothetical protein [candidate division WOR-3 bacterium]
MKHLSKKRLKDKKNKLLNFIRMLRNMKLPLNPGYIVKHYRKFYVQGIKLFGKWQKAVTAAGLNYDEIQKELKRQEQEKVINQLKNLHRRDKRFTAKYLQAHSFSFHKATRLFGSWQEAIRAAGFNPPPSYFRWSKEAVITKLKQLLYQGVRLNTANVKRIDPLLYAAGERYFGSWRATLAAIELDYDKVAILPFRGRVKRRRKIRSKPDS